jgi:hypothetical protein
MPGDPLVYGFRGFQVKANLQPAAVGVPPGFEVNPRIFEEPLRLAGADPGADASQLGWQRF